MRYGSSDLGQPKLICRHSLYSVYSSAKLVSTRTGHEMRLVFLVDKLGLTSIRATELALSWHDVDWHPLAFFRLQENDIGLAGATLLYIFRVGSGIECHAAILA